MFSANELLQIGILSGLGAIVLISTGLRVDNRDDKALWGGFGLLIIFGLSMAQWFAKLIGY